MTISGVKLLRIRVKEMSLLFYNIFILFSSLVKSQCPLKAMRFLLTALPHGDKVWGRLYDFPDPQERL